MDLFTKARLMKRIVSSAALMLALQVPLVASLVQTASAQESNQPPEAPATTDQVFDRIVENIKSSDSLSAGDNSRAASKKSAPVGAQRESLAPAPHLPSGPRHAVFFDSQYGDYIGLSQTNTWTTSTSLFNWSNTTNTVTGSIDPPSGWLWVDISLAAPVGQTLTVGTYTDAQRTPFRQPGHPGLNMAGDGRGCNELTGQFTVHEVTFEGTTMTSFAASFEQHCEGGTPALFGEVRFNSTYPFRAVQVPFSVNFPTTSPGTQSAPMNLTVTNTGFDPVSVTATSLSGANPGDFSIVSNNCNGVTLDVGQTCSASVRFAPTAIGSRSATFPFSYNTGMLTRPIVLNGTGGTPTPVNVLGDTGFEAKSPNPYWLQDSGGRALIRSDAGALGGSYSADLCRNESGTGGSDNCAEGVLQLFGAPAGTTSANITLYYRATSAEFEDCFDGIVFGLSDGAGNIIESSVGEICVYGNFGWTGRLGSVTSAIQAYANQPLYAFAIGLTDFSFPSRFFIDNFTLNIGTSPQLAPGEPTSVVATPQDGAAYVSWERPILQGSGPVTSYEVTSNPPTTTQTLTDHRGALMSGLSNSTSYTFKVKGTNSVGQGIAGISNSATPSPSLPSGPFISVPPSRILDTRPGEPADDGIEGAIPAGSSLDMQVTGKGGVPVTQTAVSAAVLNVTVTQPTAGGFLTVFPKGVAQPLASSLNFSPGQTVPNQVEVAIGQDGKVRIYNGSSGPVHLLADVQGYVASALSGTAGLYQPLSPARILDTRNGTGGFSVPIPANSSINVAVTGQGEVPTSTVDAVIMNATVTQPEGNGFLTVYPTGLSQPLVSNVNFAGGQTVPNRLHVPVGNSGQVTVFNGSPGTVHVVLDVNGWFTDGSDAGATGGLFKGLTPARIADTRLLSAAPYSGMTLMGGDTLQVKVAGQGGIPSMGSGTPPSAVVANITIVNPSHPGFLTGYPSNVAQPTISDLNWVAGDVRPNLAVVKLAPDGTIKLLNGSLGYLDVVIDVVGWYS